MHTRIAIQNFAEFEKSVQSKCRTDFCASVCGRCLLWGNEWTIFRKRSLKQGISACHILRSDFPNIPVTACMFIHLHACTHERAHTRTCTHTSAHTYTHTHICDDFEYMQPPLLKCWSSVFFLNLLFTSVDCNILDERTSPSQNIDCWYIDYTRFHLPCSTYMLYLVWICQYQ